MKLSYMIDMDKASEWLVVTAGASAKANLPYVQELGDFITHSKYYTTREGFPSYLIKYTLSGEGMLEYDNHTCQVPSGHFFWIDCEKAQHYRTSERTGDWRVLWVHFYGAGSRYFYEQFLAANGGQNSGVLPADSVVPSCIYTLMDLYKEEAGVAADIRASALLTNIMADCVTAVSREADGTALGYVREARDYMLSHYVGRVTLESLAKQLSLNKFYLQKLYRQHTGQTPAQYLLNLRLNFAKELLRATGKPVSRIAEETGIVNVSHFIKLFKRSEGITPSAYRRQWRVE